MMKRWWGAAAAMMIVVAGCGQDSHMDLKERAEQRAVEARVHIDDLASRVGTDPTVRQDKLTACVPGQDDSGLDLVYTLHVVVEPGAAERLKGEIAGHFASEGWTVKRDADHGDLISVRFQKGTFTMGAKISEPDEWAAVSGSGGCVR